jgi:cob(I)alamin adenosyltransferase
MKIYTKTGDKGDTSLIGGYRVSKSDLRIESYGTVDELNSWLGLIVEYLPQDRIEEVQRIQSLLFSMGAQLASKSKEQKRPFAEVNTDDIKTLEACIDEYEVLLPRMTHFILPGGNKGADEKVLIYLNRLSDYLFCLARALAIWDGKDEIKWIPSK